MKVRATAEASARGPSAWRLRRSLLVAVAAAGWLLSSAAADGVTTEGACIPSTNGIEVHFVLGTPAAGSDPGIAGLTLTGFDPPTCDGQPVVVTLSGNTAGDPGRTADTLMSTYDSAIDPCTGERLDSPELVTEGSIALRGCADSQDATRAAYADLHDLTLLTVRVAGEQVPTGSPPGDEVLGVEALGSDHGDGDSGTTDGATAAAANRTDALAATGGPSSLWFTLGVLLVFCGFGSLLVDLLRGSRVARAGRQSRPSRLDD